MKFTLDIKETDMHHAYLVEGDKDIVIPELFNMLDRVGVTAKANPDFWHQEFEKFGVDDARLVKSLQSKKALSGGKKIFIVVSPVFTVEAQNALLKTFEEPTPDTHFFIVMPDSESILPTLKSRMLFVGALEGGGLTDGALSDAKKFIESSPLQRLEFVKDIIENKDKEKAQKLLNNIEIFLQADGSAKHVSLMSEIAKLRGYLRQRSPSVKMIMEHLSLVAPKIK